MLSCPSQFGRSKPREVWGLGRRGNGVPWCFEKPCKHDSSMLGYIVGTSLSEILGRPKLKQTWNPTFVKVLRVYVCFDINL